MCLRSCAEDPFCYESLGKPSRDGIPALQKSPRPEKVKDFLVSQQNGVNVTHAPEKASFKVLFGSFLARLFIENYNSV